MTAQPLPSPETPAAGQVEPFQPGRCSDHPALELVTRQDAGIRRWYGYQLTRVVCPDPHAGGRTHRWNPGEVLDRYRCRHCGGPLFPNDRVNDLKEYCKPACRLSAWRASKRA